MVLGRKKNRGARVNTTSEVQIVRGHTRDNDPRIDPGRPAAGGASTQVAKQVTGG